jgi:hypothetical protein
MTTTLTVRVLLFYVVSMFLILCTVAWNSIKPGTSPFVAALVQVGIPGAALTMNFVVLTAVLSCLNSGLYVTSRVLFDLAANGDAPQALVALSRRRVPVRAILTGSAFGYAALIASVVSPTGVFSFLVKCLRRGDASALSDGRNGANTAPHGHGARRIRRAGIQDVVVSLAQLRGANGHLGGTDRHGVLSRP